MSKSNDEILKEFLLTALEDDSFRAIRFEFDSIPGFKGLLPVHLSNGGASKEIFLNSYDLTRKGIELYNTNTELRKIAVDQFRRKFDLPTIYGSPDFTE